MITFNGVHAPDWLLFMRPTLDGPQRSLKLVTVPGKAGSYLEAIEDGVRTLVFSVAVEAVTYAESVAYEDALVAWLRTDSPESLILDYTPDRQVMAISTSDISLEWTGDTATGTLTFVCPDPRKYATTEDATAILVGSNTIANGGGIPERARFELTPSQPTAFIRLTAENGTYVQVGQAPVEDTPPVVTDIVPLDDSCSGMVGWSQGSICDGGVVAGTMVSNGSSISPMWDGGDWGTGARWHGPSSRQALGQTVADFEIDIQCSLDTHSRTDAMERIDIWLLDGSMQQFANLRIYDSWQDKTDKAVSCRVGTHVIHNGTDNGVWDWPKNSTTPPHRGFKGYLRLSRSGNVWTFRASQYKADGTTSDTHTWTWTDTDGTVTSLLAAVEVNIAAFGTHGTPDAALVDRVRVTSKQVTTTAPAVLMRAGDAVTVDMFDASVRLNGEPWMSQVDWGSRFFDLASGDNVVAIASDDAALTGTSYLRKRWL